MGWGGGVCERGRQEKASEVLVKKGSKVAGRETVFSPSCTVADVVHEKRQSWLSYQSWNWSIIVETLAA